MVQKKMDLGYKSKVARGGEEGCAEVALPVLSGSSRFCYALVSPKNFLRNHCIDWPSTRPTQLSTFFGGVVSRPPLRSRSVHVPTIGPRASTRLVMPS